MKEESTGNRGQSTLEILIALALLVTALSGAIIAIFGGQSVALESQQGNLALSMAREDLGRMIGEARLNYQGLASSTTAVDEFVREVIVESTGSSTKKITARVTWQPTPLRTKKVELVSLVTNWYATLQSGSDTGGTGVIGDWTNPRTLGSVDLGAGNSATDLDVKNKIVYISTEASSGNKPDLYVVDATNGSSPSILTSLETGQGTNSIDVAGNYAYLAHKNGSDQLQIVNITVPSAPSYITSFTPPGVSGPSATGRTIFYASGLVYLGLGKANGAEFHIIDVTNPLNPQAVGSYEVNDNVNDVYVSGTRAYLATDKTDAGLIILDISNPAAPAFLGQTYSSDTNSVYEISQELVLAGPGQDLYLASTTNPAAISTRGYLGIGSAVNDIISNGNLAFIATSDSNKEFQVVNISNPAAPIPHSSFNFSQVGTGIDFEDNIVYVSVRSNDALRIITSTQ